MSMYCYQCQETAKNSGCTIKGVCGKTEEVDNMQDLLVYVCKGLSYVTIEARKQGIKKREEIQGIKIVKWSLDCLTGLEELHNKGYIHRDFKTE